MVKSAQEIGFGQEILLGQRRFFVQTEVYSSAAGLTVRSLILEGGVVRDSATAPYPTDVADLIAGEKLVKQQHDAMVNKLQLGELVLTQKSGGGVVG